MNTSSHLLLSDIHIRSIQSADNPSLAIIVRNTLTEFGANVPGTVFFDPTTDALYELFRMEAIGLSGSRSGVVVFWVVAASSPPKVCRMIPANW